VKDELKYKTDHDYILGIYSFRVSRITDRHLDVQMYSACV